MEEDFFKHIIRKIDNIETNVIEQGKSIVRVETKLDVNNKIQDVVEKKVVEHEAKFNIMSGVTKAAFFVSVGVNTIIAFVLTNFGKWFN